MEAYLTKGPGDSNYAGTDTPTRKCAGFAVHLETVPELNNSQQRLSRAQENQRRPSLKHLFVFNTAQQTPILACALVTACLAAAGKALYSVLLGKIFDVVSRFGGGKLGGDDALAQVSRWCAFLVGLGAAFWIINGLDMALWTLFGEFKARSAREALFSSLLAKDTEWHDTKEVGIASMAIRSQSQIRELQVATSQILGFLICDTFVFFSCFMVALVYSYKLTLVMAATGVPSVIVLHLVNRSLDKAIPAQKYELAQASTHAAAAITAIDLVKVHNASDHESRLYMHAIYRSARHYLRQAVCNCAQMGYIKFWMITLFVLGFYFSIILCNRGDLTPGDALTTFYAVLTAFESVEAIGPHWLAVAKGMAAGQSLEGLMETEASGDRGSHEKGRYRPMGCAGRIEVQNVNFAYPSNPSLSVLKSSAFLFPAGELTFLVGKSGSGKSTLGNLLVRFYEPSTGNISLDSTPLGCLDLHWLRNNITLIQQSSILFCDTFFNNVAVGARDPGSVSEKDVSEACGLALLRSTIAGLPEGLDTVIGPGGHNLSGGQQQRLALARARLRDPPVLVLDEITSGLDPSNRALIMDSIRRWRRGKTTIIITHDVAQIEEHEYVYVLEGGRVVQEGTQRTLAAAEKGLFASLIASADENPGDTNYDNPPEASDTGSGVQGRTPLYRGDTTSTVRRKSRLSWKIAGASDGGYQSRSWAFGRLSIGVATIEATRVRSQQLWNEPDVTDGQPIPKECTTLSLNRHAESHERCFAAVPEQNFSNRASLEIMKRSIDAVQTSRTGTHKAELYEQPFRDNSESTDSTAHLVNRHQAESEAGVEESAPSLAAILRTVWPTIDSRGRVDLVLGLSFCLVVAGSSPAFSYIFARILENFWSSPETHGEAGSKWAAYLAVVGVIDGAATFLSYFLVERASQAWINTLRGEAITRILAQHKSWFDRAEHSPARVNQCLDRNAEEVRKLLSQFVPAMVIVAGMIITSFAWALATRWDLTLVALAGAPGVAAVAWVNSTVGDKWEAICNTAASNTGVIFCDTLASIRVVRALTLERLFIRRHKRSAQATLQAGVRRAWCLGLVYGMYQSLSHFITAVTFYYGMRILRNGEVSVTDVLRIINLLLFSLGNSIVLLGNTPQISAAKSTATQILYYANLPFDENHDQHRPHHILDNEMLVNGDSNRTKALATPLPIQLTNLCFAYPSRPDTRVLHNITLRVDAGTCTAIVGASGCGKSTLGSLLLRLYDPDPTNFSPINLQSNHHTPMTMTPPPSLAFSSHPFSTLSTPSLRAHTAYVPQHPILFPTTLRANILYGRSRLEQSDIFLCESAARAAGIHDFALSLPNGYDTTIANSSGGGGGAVAVLSGGQAQRVCIARALARRPSLLVLDEPTSALDAQAAEGVREVVAELVAASRGPKYEVGEMAVVVVTHSKEMMRIADKIVVMNQGSIVETGRYEELVGRRGVFARLIGAGARRGR